MQTVTPSRSEQLPGQASTASFAAWGKVTALSNTTARVGTICIGRTLGREMTKKLLVSTLLALLSLPAIAQEGLPKDVEKFIAKREGCDHFRGEIPDLGEKRRMREVNREIRRLCGGTDRALAQLKRKYAMDEVVMQRLSEFDAQIETNDLQQPKRSTTKLPK